jgi:hypothetical protein
MLASVSAGAAGAGAGAAACELVSVVDVAGFVVSTEP